MWCQTLGRGFAWPDTGTHDSLSEASTFIEVIEKRQGSEDRLPGGHAYRQGWITAEKLREEVAPIPTNQYVQYLPKVIGGSRTHGRGEPLIAEYTMNITTDIHRRRGHRRAAPFPGRAGDTFESFSQREFGEKVRAVNFVQDNESRSTCGVLRGFISSVPLMLSRSWFGACGAVLDVAVDIRRGSPTYGRHVAVELTEDNHLQLFIPRGFAHGFAVLSGGGGLPVQVRRLIRSGSGRWHLDTGCVAGHRLAYPGGEDHPEREGPPPFRLSDAEGRVRIRRGRVFTINDDRIS